MTSENEFEISPSGLMDLENAAIYLGVKPNTIMWLRRKRKIPCMKLGGRLHFLKDDLDQWLREKKEE